MLPENTNTNFASASVITSDVNRRRPTTVGERFLIGIITGFLIAIVRTTVGVLFSMIFLRPEDYPSSAKPVLIWLLVILLIIFVIVDVALQVVFLLDLRKNVFKEDYIIYATAVNAIVIIICGVLCNHMVFTLDVSYTNVGGYMLADGLVASMDIITLCVTLLWGKSKNPNPPHLNTPRRDIQFECAL